MSNVHGLLLRLVVVLILAATGTGTPAWLSAVMPASFDIEGLRPEQLDPTLLAPDQGVQDPVVGDDQANADVADLPPVADDGTGTEDAPADDAQGSSASEGPTGDGSQPSGDDTVPPAEGDTTSSPDGTGENTTSDPGETEGEPPSPPSPDQSISGPDQDSGQGGSNPPAGSEETGSAVPVDVQTPTPKPVEGGQTKIEPGRTFRVEMSPGDSAEIALTVENLGFAGTASLPDRKEWVRVPPARAGVNAELIDSRTRSLLGSVDGDDWPETDALDVGDVQAVSLLVEAPAEAAPGDYEVRYEVRSLGDPSQIVTVRVLVTVRAPEVQDTSVAQPTPEPTPSGEDG